MKEKLFKMMSQKGIGTVPGLLGGICFMLLFGVFPAWAGASGLILSEQKAIRLGLERPEIGQQMEAYVQLAENEVAATRTWANPEFSYDQESLSNGPDDITDRNYMLSQEFKLPGKRSLATEAAMQRLDVVSQENSQWKLERTSDIRQKFYEVLHHQRLHSIFAQWLTGMKEIEAVMNKRKDAGDISGYDLDRLKREQVFIKARQQQTHAEYERFNQELLAVIGMTGKETGLSGLTGSLLPANSPLPLEELLAHVENQPEFMAMRLQSKAYGVDERLAQRGWLPDVTLGLGIKDTENSEGDALLFSLSMPIPVFDRSSVEQERAQVSRRQIENRYNLAMSEREGMIRGLWEQLSGLSEAVAPLNDEGCEDLVQKAEVAYKAGEIGALEILDAYRSSFENRAQILSLMRQVRMVRIELDLITGGEI